MDAKKAISTKYNLVFISFIIAISLSLLFYFLPFHKIPISENEVAKIYFADNMTPAHTKIISLFNDKYQGQIEIIPVNLPFTKFNTNERKELIARALRNRTSRIDVFSVDQIWVSRFAKWAEPLSRYFSNKEKANILPHALSTCYYENTLVSIPLHIDIGVMYYRRDIIEKFPDGRSRVRFKTVSTTDTPGCMKELVKLYRDALDEHRIPPLVLLASFDLDLLCIHPFCDGNGRVSRLLLLLQCYHLEFEVGRYISLERLIEQNKERYYETLEQSSQGWHEGQHTPWPYINYVLSIIKMAYREFEQRLGRLQIPKGEKTSLILHAIDTTLGSFSVAELQNKCPNVSVDMIRRVLKSLRSKDQVECLGRGQKARWQKTADWQLGNVE